MTGREIRDYLQGFIDDELRQLNQTAANIKARKPPRAKTRRKRK